ncbi:MAG TPA: GNAT family N-acetyltransferase [Elusimicrobiota bacterium]|nr:GNAT family N-acetyltransferase [Elusimicrobiota bacterium]
MTIRRAFPDDIPAIADLFQSAFPEALAAVFGRPRLPPAAVQDVFELIFCYEPPGLFVAQDNGAILGFVSVVSDRERFHRRVLGPRGVLRLLARWLFGRYRGLGLAFVPRLLRAAWRYRRGETAALPKEPAAQFLSIVVRQDARRRGLGAALLEAALAYLRQTPATAARLEVDAGKAAVVSLYRRFGFSETGRIPSPRGPALIMLRSLSGSKN